jgi:hypothetical protein
MLKAAFGRPFFFAFTDKEAAKVAPDGSHWVDCVVTAYDAHAVTCPATLSP